MTFALNVIASAFMARDNPYLVREIETGLEPLQKAVGGLIEAVYPFEEPVAIVCIGGLTYATLTTAFIIPVLYDLLRRDKRPDPAPAPEPASQAEQA